MASVPKISLKMAESIVPVGMAGLSNQRVMAGLVPAIHALLIKTWMPGTRPGMTNEGLG
jgi:hypothetical protein